MDYGKQFLDSFNHISKTYPRKAPPVPVGHPSIGIFGEVHGQVGFILKGMGSRTFKALMKDESYVRKKWYDKFYKYIDGQRGAITSWDDVLNARGTNNFDDVQVQKDSITTVANATSNLYRATGFPTAGTYSNIPNGAIHNVDSVGAIPLVYRSGKDAYFWNLGARMATGTNILLLYDLIIAGNNINANSTAAQSITFPSLPRYTDGNGVMMTFEVTTALGSTASNMTVTYTDSGGTSGRTATFAMTTSAIVMRLQPVQFWVTIPYSGVRTITQVQFSAAMGAGVLAALLFKPLTFIPTLATTTQVEKSIPSQISGMTPLPLGTDGKLGCLTFITLTSGTSTGVSNFLVQVLYG